MELSEVLGHTGLCCLSPDSSFLAVVHGSTLILRNAQTLMVERALNCPEKISQVEWSPNSALIFCTVPKKDLLQVWSVKDPSWSASIQEQEAAGLVFARWSPSSDHIVTSSDFKLRLSIWSLSSARDRCLQIPHPKHASKAAAFSPHGLFFAVTTVTNVVGPNPKDLVSIYSTATWQQLSQFYPTTSDLADLSWAPDSSCIAAWDGAHDFKLLLFSPDGRPLLSVQPDLPSPGIRSVRWTPHPSSPLPPPPSPTSFSSPSPSPSPSPSISLSTLPPPPPPPTSPLSLLLAISSSSFSNASIEIVSPLTLSSLSPLLLTSPVNSAATVFRERLPASAPSLSFPSTAASARQPGRSVELTLDVGGCFELLPLPLNLTPLSQSQQKGGGVGALAWSPNGRFLACRSDQFPSVIWVWDVVRTKIATLFLMLSPNVSFAWQPRDDSPMLFFSSGGAWLHSWAQDNPPCSAFIGEEIAASELAFGSTGDVLLVKNKTQCCLLHFTRIG